MRVFLLSPRVFLSAPLVPKNLHFRLGSATKAAWPRQPIRKVDLRPQFIYYEHSLLLLRLAVEYRFSRVDLKPIGTVARGGCNIFIVILHIYNTMK